MDSSSGAHPPSKPLNKITVSGITVADLKSVHNHWQILFIGMGLLLAFLGCFFMLVSLVLAEIPWRIVGASQIVLGACSAVLGSCWWACSIKHRQRAKNKAAMLRAPMMHHCVDPEEENLTDDSHDR